MEPLAWIFATVGIVGFVLVLIAIRSPSLRTKQIIAIGIFSIVLMLVSVILLKMEIDVGAGKNRALEKENALLALKQEKLKSQLDRVSGRRESWEPEIEKNKKIIEFLTAELNEISKMMNALIGEFNVVREGIIEKLRKGLEALKVQFLEFENKYKLLKQLIQETKRQIPTMGPSTRQKRTEKENKPPSTGLPIIKEPWKPLRLIDEEEYQ